MVLFQEGEPHGTTVEVDVASRRGKNSSPARPFSSVMTCFLDQAVPGLGPARCSWTIWNVCLSALGTVPSIQSRCTELKPSSSALNNDWNSNVLTPAPTHRPSCFPAPARINRSVSSGVRTSFLWSPL